MDYKICKATLNDLERIASQVLTQFIQQAKKEKRAGMVLTLP